MKITQKTLYAIQALRDLKWCADGSEQPIRLKDLAERNNLPLFLLEQIFSDLRKKNLVKAHRGPGGGYTLGTKKCITYAEVMDAVGETIAVPEEVAGLAKIVADFKKQIQTSAI